MTQVVSIVDKIKVPTPLEDKLENLYGYECAMCEYYDNKMNYLRELVKKKAISPRNADREANKLFLEYYSKMISYCKEHW